jgi:hypothetical protein
MILLRASALKFETIAFCTLNNRCSRHAHVLIGGKNANSALSDVWVYVFVSSTPSPLKLPPGI